MTTSNTFNCISIDPPWEERGGGKIKRGANRHYEIVPIKEMAPLILGARVWRPADDALLWLWATTSFIEAAIELIPALGFRRCATFVWAKIDVVDAERGTFAPPGRMGLGQWSRVEHEFLLLGRRGAPKVPGPADRQRSMIYAPRGAHSEKPAAAFHVIETTSRAALGELRCLEMFARTARPGWSSWGFEAPEQEQEQEPESEPATASAVPDWWVEDDEVAA